MSRSKWKGPYINEKMLINLNTHNLNLQKNYKIFNKSFIIIPKFIGLTFNIYNGKNFSKLKITEEMLGHKLGEFILTRKKFNFKKKKRI